MDTLVHDYYEFLQISPNADAETIHRVYRFLAARMHPDNIQTGHEENFRLLKAAYDVLSDPHRRKDYDFARAQAPAPVEPLAAIVDFMDVLDGELNRRLAVLAVLYYRRRTNPAFPQIPLSEIEERMGFPRDYLDFTLWYLQKKGYIAKTDNAQYTLSVDGVDFVETQRANLPTLHKLLTSGSGSSVEDLARAPHKEAAAASEPGDAAAKTTHIKPEHGQSAKHQQVRVPGPIELPSSMSNPEDRRQGRQERRTGKPDLRDKKMERRFHVQDRREEQARPAVIRHAATREPQFPRPSSSGRDGCVPGPEVPPRD
jgi:curved DNA-binding protein